MRFREMLRLAAKHGACEETLSVLRSFTSKQHALMDDSAPYWCWWFVSKVLKVPYPEFEPAIAKSPKLAFAYARRILVDRFPEGEAAICSNPDTRDRYLKFLQNYGNH